MSTQLKLRRGTTAQHSTFTGAEGEVTVDTTKDTLVVHDGTTAGGVALSKAADTVNLTGAQTIAGVKTFSSDAVIQGLTVGRGAGTVATNTAVGASALAANTSGADNTAVGYQALKANTTGVENTAVGEGALTTNTSGGFNSAHGLYALRLNTTGSNNTSVGHGSLQSNTTANNNTAVGYQAAYSSVTGAQLTAVGFGALKATTASWSTAVGYSSGFANTTGVITSIGTFALYSNTTGVSNIAVGGYDPSNYSGAALTSNTTGSNNVAVGTGALTANTVADNNTAVGYRAAFSNTTGAQNTTIGRGAHNTATTASGNVAVGASAGNSNVSGYGNTLIGYEAGYYVTGGGNVVLGTATTSSYAPVANLSTESNRVAIGSSAVTNAYIQVAWTVVSDARDKINFAPVPHGLDFVTKLNPVQYQFTETRGDTAPHGPVRYGFKAQDILALEGDTPVIIDTENSEKLRYNGESLVPVLVKAIQELKAEFDAYKASHP